MHLDGPDSARVPELKEVREAHRGHVERASLSFRVAGVAGAPVALALDNLLPHYADPVQALLDLLADTPWHSAVDLRLLTSSRDDLLATLPSSLGAGLSPTALLVVLSHLLQRI